MSASPVSWAPRRQIERSSSSSDVPAVPLSFRAHHLHAPSRSTSSIRQRLRMMDSVAISNGSTVAAQAQAQADRDLAAALAKLNAAQAEADRLAKRQAVARVQVAR